MALELKLGLKLSQKLIMTPSLQQAIKLLQMSKLELVEEVTQELTENPVLEEAGLEESGPDGDRSGEEDSKEAELSGSETAENTDNDGIDDRDIEAFFQEFADAGYTPRQGNQEFRELTSFEATLSKPPNLNDYLLWQLRMNVSGDARQEVAECIIGNLDADGYLQATMEEIQELAQCSPEKVQEALEIVQGFDPPGVGAANLQECLLLQLRHLDLEDTPAAQVVREHLERLQDHRYPEMAERMGCSLEEVRHFAEIVRSLDPRPGRKYSVDSSHYVVPDVFVLKIDKGYTIILNEDGLPKLRISPVYRQMLNRSNRTVSREDREFLREKFRAAFRLIKSIEERQRTIYKVACSIVKHQRDFLDYGFERLRPLVLRDVAQDIEMHESTVSRVVNNKFMHTHRGLFEMRFFFHSGISSSLGEDVSSLAVKQRIRKLVEQEDPSHPLSDSRIVKMLEQDSLRIARRTVAKYREELRIPSSTFRKRAHQR
ncbi:MAG: RNA polymerase factor sigma-54 [Acidobacteriota bacterium]